MESFLSPFPARSVALASMAGLAVAAIVVLLSFAQPGDSDAQTAVFYAGETDTFAIGELASFLA